MGPGVKGWTQGQRVGVGWHGGHVAVVSHATEAILSFANVGWFRGLIMMMTGIKPMIEDFPLEHPAEAYEGMMSGEARFRVVCKVS
ncbi:MAG: hypothetical protein NPIRA03_15440 [Nitrospirales bacterium]|nr:MAG: hypothetical protein NPIRA03_15440 [Nitrospirales bacterium]